MRTFHSIPCLQRDEFSKKNLQDAPRIKTMLKSCVLPSEVGQSAASLPEIAKRSVSTDDVIVMRLMGLMSTCITG